MGNGYEPIGDKDAIELLMNLRLAHKKASLNNGQAEWQPNGLGLVNAVLDAILPGVFIAVDFDEKTQTIKGFSFCKEKGAKTKGVAHTDDIRKALIKLIDSL